MSSHNIPQKIPAHTLPETNSSPLKIGAPLEKESPIGNPDF